MMADALGAVSAESNSEFVFPGMDQHAQVASMALCARPVRVPRLPREMRCAQRDGMRAAKHKRLCLLRAKVAQQSRRCLVEDRCAVAIKTEKSAAIQPLAPIRWSIA